MPARMADGIEKGAFGPLIIAALLQRLYHDLLNGSRVIGFCLLQHRFPIREIGFS